MGREEDGLLHLHRKSTEQLNYFHLTGEVEEGSGFVEVDDRRLLCKCLGNHHFLSFSVAQGVHHPISKSFDAHHTDGLVNDAEVLSRIASPEARVGGATQADELADGHIPYVGLLRQYHTNQSTQLLVCIAPNLFPLNEHLTTYLWLEGREGAQKGGLTDAVAAQQTGELATVDGGIHASSHHPDILLALIADTQLTQFYGLLAHGLYVLFELLHELV